MKSDLKAATSYIVRFDDICPTMNWRVWNRIEQILGEYRIKPLLAVVPDNQDWKLKSETANEKFWDKCRAWQASGWALAVHGWQHLPITTCRGLVGIKRQSEFAGLPLEQQIDKLSHSVAVFQRERLDARIFIAPSHTFDQNTLIALQRVGIGILSDGGFRWPGVDATGMLWVPQQACRFSNRPKGVWTVCLHHNAWTEAMMKQFAKDLRRFHSHCVSLDTVLSQFGQREHSLQDRMVATVDLQLRRLQASVIRALRKNSPRTV